MSFRLFRQKSAAYEAQRAPVHDYLVLCIHVLCGWTVSAFFHGSGKVASQAGLISPSRLFQRSGRRPSLSLFRYHRYQCHPGQGLMHLSGSTKRGHKGFEQKWLSVFDTQNGFTRGHFSPTFLLPFNARAGCFAIPSLWPAPGRLLEVFLENPPLTDPRVPARMILCAVLLLPWVLKDPRAH